VAPSSDQAHQGAIRIQHRTIWQAEAGGTVEYLPSATAARKRLELKRRLTITCARVTAGRRQVDDLAYGIEFEQRVAVGQTHDSELLWHEPQKLQCIQGWRQESRWHDPDSTP
jgi:hypothetical protein